MSKQSEVSKAKQRLDSLTEQQAEADRTIAELEVKFEQVNEVDYDLAYAQIAGDSDKLSAARIVSRSLAAQIAVATKELHAAEQAQAKVDYYASKRSQVAKVETSLKALDAAIAALHDSASDHNSAAIARQIWKENAASHYNPWANMVQRLEADRIKLAAWVEQTDK